ncbi:MAG: transglutaminase-like domain-containing protein [Candidatus Fimivivens sp.]|nr:transglutaminase-like domain-containing protein [Candidatus Fimivivens sp.]
MKLHRGSSLQLALSPDKATSGVDLTEMFGNIALALLLYFGLGGLLVSLFKLPVLGVVPALLGVLIITCAFAFCHTAQSRLLGVAMLITCIIILWILAAKYARAGLSLTLNSLSTAVDIEFLRINAQYTIDVAPAIHLACGTLFLTPFAVLLALACIFIVRKTLYWVGLVILAPFVAVSVFEAVNHTGMWSALLLTGVALLLCRCLAAVSSAKDTGGAMLSMGAVLLVACLIGSGILLLTPGNIPEKTAYLLEKNQRNILTTVHRMRYESNTHIVLPEGNFTDISAPDISYEPVLNLKMSKPDSIYLRGYVGEVYTDFGWQPIDKKVMNTYTSLFYQLHKSNFYPQTQLAVLAEILDETLTEEDVLTLEVENPAACRGYIYAPYELLKADNALLPVNNLLESRLMSDGVFGTKDYKLAMLPNQVKRYKKLAEMLEQQSTNPSDALRSYLEQENKYRSFVYEQYTAISPEDSALLTAYIGEPGIAGQTHVAYKDAKNNILAILSRQLEYSDENAAFDGNGSFLRYVLRKNQSASTVGYASVAVMMLRHYGIPARYVEGYLITPDDAEAVGDDTDIEILDYSAHAWAEYYHDGVGWIPFEVDPNYLGVMEGITDPPSYGQSNQGGADQEPEIEPPEHDRDRHRDEDAGFLDNLLYTLRLLLPLLLTLLAFAALVGAWLYYRFKSLQKRKKDCDQSDNNAAVCSMMAYILALLGAVGIEESTYSPITLLPKVTECLGGPIGDEYGDAVCVFLKAAFSRHTVQQTERDAVSALLQHIIAWLEQSQPRKKRFIIRYLKCLY